VFHNGKTVLRAGYAYMADQPVSNTVTPLASNPPLSTPVSFAATKGSTIHVSNLLNEANLASGVAPSSIDENFRNALVSDYNVNIQQQVTPTVGVMIGYFGSKASHLRLSRNLNPILVSTNKHLIQNLSATSPISPGASLGNVQTIDDAGNANYNALWISANKRTSHGFQFNGSYTFSKSLDYNSLNSQGQVIQNSLNPRDSYGLSDFDARHRFVFNGIYDLPFKSNRLISGWELSGILQLQTGNPITILTANTFTGNATIRPDLIGSIAFPNTLLPNGNIQYFSGTTCTTPTAGCTFLNTNTHFGDMARNSIIGPGFANLDFSFIKNTKLSERFTHQFRAEMFDLTNHPNFGQPSRILGGTLGQIASTRFPTGDSGSSRQIQFAMKLIF
jgi:hypothetical protein